MTELEELIKKAEIAADAYTKADRKGAPYMRRLLSDLRKIHGMEQPIDSSPWAMRIVKTAKEALKTVSLAPAEEGDNKQPNPEEKSDVTPPSSSEGKSEGRTWTPKS